MPLNLFQIHFVKKLSPTFSNGYCFVAFKTDQTLSSSTTTDMTIPSTSTSPSTVVATATTITTTVANNNNNNNNNNNKEPVEWPIAVGQSPSIRDDDDDDADKNQKQKKIDPLLLPEPVISCGEEEEEEHLDHQTHLDLAPVLVKATRRKLHELGRKDNVQDKREMKAIDDLQGQANQCMGAKRIKLLDAIHEECDKIKEIAAMVVEGKEGKKDMFLEAHCDMIDAEARINALREQMVENDKKAVRLRRQQLARMCDLWGAAQMAEEEDEASAFGGDTSREEARQIYYEIRRKHVKGGWNSMEKRENSEGEALDDEEVHAIWDKKYPRAMLASGLLGDYVGQAVRAAWNNNIK